MLSSLKCLDETQLVKLSPLRQAGYVAVEVPGNDCRDSAVTDSLECRVEQEGIGVEERWFQRCTRYRHAGPPNPALCGEWRWD